MNSIISFPKIGDMLVRYAGFPLHHIDILLSEHLNATKRFIILKHRQCITGQGIHSRDGNKQGVLAGST